MKKNNGNSGSSSGLGSGFGSDYIPVITKNKYYKINLDDIEIIEQRSNKLYVKDVFRGEYVFRGTISELVPILVGRGFFRAMKKVIVNFDNVESVESDVINFRSGMKYGVGRNNLLKVRKGYRNYLYGYPPFFGKESAPLLGIGEPDAREEWESILSESDDTEEVEGILRESDNDIT